MSAPKEGFGEMARDAGIGTPPAQPYKGAAARKRSLSHKRGRGQPGSGPKRGQPPVQGAARRATKSRKRRH